MITIFILCVMNKTLVANIYLNIRNSDIYRLATLFRDMQRSALSSNQFIFIARNDK